MKQDNQTDITVTISTKDRYFTTLPLAIMSVVMQEVKPKELWIYDDGEQRDLREISLYQNLFHLLHCKGIHWEVKFGARQGQVVNHQNALDNVKTEFILRMDDDNYLESNVIKTLIKHTKDEKVGAIGGLVFHPNIPMALSPLASNKIDDTFLFPTVQWFKQPARVITEDVEHLYSTFIYRKEAGKHGYCKELSPIGHREETMFTYEMVRSGWKLVIDTGCITWHLRENKGGIRSGYDMIMWQHDDNIFETKLKEWGKGRKSYNLIVLDNGIGDHIVFKKLLPKIKKSKKDIILAVCYPEVFKDNTDLTIISIAEARMLTNIDRYNIYKWMWDKNWKKGLYEAFTEIYLNENQDLAIR